MNKRILWLIAALMTLGTITVQGQTTTGSWTSIPTFGTTYTAVVETPSRTFALADGFLMAISDNETTFFDRQNKLSDYNIALIRYNYTKGYLLVAYTNGNIDLIYDDDRVVNMPDIKDAALSTSREITNVDFGGDYIAVATKFGVVLFDDERHEVFDSGIYNVEVSNALIMGDKLMIYANNKLYISPVDKRHPQLSSYDPVMNGTAQAGMWDAIARISDNSFIRIASNPANTVYMYTISPENTMSSALLATNIKGKGFSYLSGKVAVTAADTQVIVDNQGNAERVSIPAAVKGTDSFSGGSASSVWTTGTKGISHHDLSATTPTVLMDWYKPMASPVMRPADLVWSADGEKLYISHVGRSAILPELIDIPMKVCVLDRDNRITNLSFQNRGSVRRLAVDPLDNDIFYYAHGYNGFDVYNSEGLIKAVTKDNFPAISSNPSIQAPTNFSFDKEYNLWCVFFNEEGDKFLIVLPRSGNSQYDWSNVTASDWKIYPAQFSNRVSTWDTNLVFHSTKPYALAINSTYIGGYLVIKHNNTLLDFSDDTISDHPSLVDQTGSSNEKSTVYCAVEDKNGAFWIGSDYGVMVMSDPADAMSPDYTLTRPLVARNDGTNYGDYLLATDKIYSIAVDHTNRKWIGTADSGLYLVSEDGSEILQHFTVDNSPLPTNSVYAVSVDPQSSAVYIGTENGLYVYNGSSSPAADDYSDIHVYPNPVRPDYTGWITVTGLMDNSLVKIADAYGNVVHTTRSEGGSMVWDGCNAAGERVRTGVYFILASQNENGNSGAVAKITVIN